LSRGPSGLRHSLRALRHRPFRIYWVGQFVSVSGTWMQNMALAWLVYRLTSSPFMLGVLSAARFGPSLVGSLVAGVITDRTPRVRLVLTTQALSMLQAATLATLTLTGLVRVWEILLLALLQGFVDTLDMPARQTLQMDIVGPADLQSAVALNAAAFNIGRMVGPSVAGVVVAVLGEGPCFAANAVSYAAVLVALFTIRGALTGSPASNERMGLAREIGEGLRHAWRDPRMRVVLRAVAVTSAFGLAYLPLLPVLARDTLNAGSSGYGLLLAGGGLGATIGALAAAMRRGEGGTARIIGAAQAALGLGMVLLGASRHLVASGACMVLVGAAVAVQLTTTNAFLQVNAPPGLRGRVMSLYAWLFSGLAPIGGLSAGWAAGHVGAPWTAAGAGTLCLASAAVLLAEIPSLRRTLRRAGAGAASDGRVP
jgi:MFS family permease